MRLNRQYSTAKKQQGGALTIAVFVIVVMSLLSIAISRSISASSGQSAHEVLGTRALLAAEAGNELTLNAIFPRAAGAAVPNQACPADSSIRFPVQAEGLRNCVVTATCRSFSPPGATGNDIYYFLESTGVCKGHLQNNNTDFECQSTDSICVSRRLEVEAKAI